MSWLASPSGERIPVVPQRAALTSADALSFHAAEIAQVFRCEVYNLYGSREVSDIAWNYQTRALGAAVGEFHEIVDERWGIGPAGN